MLRTIGLPELLIILVVGLLCLAPTIFYLLSLQRVLERCSPALRTMSPGKVWLLLIPVFNLVWNFIIVIHISDSVAREFASRHTDGSEAAPGKSVGLAMCILSVASIIPIVGVLTGVAGFVCWIVYWVKVSDMNRRLEQPNRLANTSVAEI